MSGLSALRKRTPLLIFILLAIFCLIALGLACVCAADHPGQSIDRAFSVIPAAQPVVEVWSFAILVLMSAVLVQGTVRTKKLSPVQLQRLTL